MLKKNVDKYQNMILVFVYVFFNVNIFLYYKKVLRTSHNIKYNETEIFALQNLRRKKTRTLKRYK